MIYAYVVSIFNLLIIVNNLKTIQQFNRFISDGTTFDDVFDLKYREPNRN